MLSDVTILSQISWLKMPKDYHFEHMYLGGDINVGREKGEKKHKEVMSDQQRVSQKEGKALCTHL